MKRAILVALALLVAGIAHAGEDGSRSSYRAVIDRVDLEPASITGLRLRVYLSALGVNGHLLDLTDSRSVKLYLGTHERRFPYALGYYGETDADTAIVFCVQATLDYADALPLIGEALQREVIGALPDHTRLAILTYGASTSAGHLAPIKSVRSRGLTLSSDGSAGDPSLLDTLDRALRLLHHVKTEPPGREVRKMIVVIGDGRSRSGDRERVTRTGKRAAHEGIRIHTIAYSANDVRRPMLVLGELSKQSLGTLRWVRANGADSWGAAFKQLHDEIDRQYVITYFVTAQDDVAGKKLHVVTAGRTVAESNAVRIPDEPACAGQPCHSGYCALDRCIQPAQDAGTGILGWILWIAGIVIGALVLLGVIGYLMARGQGGAAQPGVPGVPPGAVPAVSGVPGVPGAPGVVPGAAGVPAAMPGKRRRGKKQKAAAVVAPGMLPSGRPIPALLIVNGPRAGERLLLRHGFWIGKQPGCDLLIEDGYTSSQHAQIGMDAMGTCTIFDRGSTNGTFVNGVKITQMTLEHGVTLRIGSTELRFLAQ